MDARERSAAFPDDEDVQCLGSCDSENMMMSDGGGGGGGGGESLGLVFIRSESSLQASAAFLLEPFVLASAPSVFLEPLEG